MFRRIFAAERGSKQKNQIEKYKSKKGSPPSVKWSEDAKVTVSEEIMNKRIREYGIIIGSGKPGTKNKITDVPGVKVGNVTLNEGDHNTGVTVSYTHLHMD